jgi:GNAT superfamily N-acetyltransferase
VRWTIRAGEWSDAPALARLIDGFAVGHPAANVPRPAEKLAPHYLGEARLGNVLLAELSGRAIGYAMWRRGFDVFWWKECGEFVDLYVDPEHRGIGVAATLIARVCADVRRSGGEYLCGYPNEESARFYDRFAIAYPSRWCHVSERAFHRLADLAGSDPRTLLRGLPDKSWNKLRASEEGL